MATGSGRADDVEGSTLPSLASNVMRTGAHRGARGAPPGGGRRAVALTRGSREPRGA